MLPIKSLTQISSTFVKSRLWCQGSKNSAHSYIVKITFFTLILIKSCDLYHTELQVLEYLSGLIPNDLYKSQRNWKGKRKIQGHLNTSWKYFSNANECCSGLCGHRLHTNPQRKKMTVSKISLFLCQAAVAQPYHKPVRVVTNSPSQYFSVFLVDTRLAWQSNKWVKPKRETSKRAQQVISAPHSILKPLFCNWFTGFLTV